MTNPTKINSINPVQMSSSNDSNFPEMQNSGILFKLSKRDEQKPIINHNFEQGYISELEIENLTREIRIKTGTDQNLSDIDVNKISDKLAFKIEETEFTDPNISGKIIVNNGQRLIYINKNDTEARKRFTIAHELGHAILHKENNKTDYRKYDRGYNKKEFQANLFASSLLMPKQLITNIWLSSFDIKFIAEYFKVSQSAVAIRLVNLGLLS